MSLSDKRRKIQQTRMSQVSIAIVQRNKRRMVQTRYSLKWNLSSFTIEHLRRSSGMALSCKLWLLLGRVPGPIAFFCVARQLFWFTSLEKLSAELVPVDSGARVRRASSKIYHSHRRCWSGLFLNYSLWVFGIRVSINSSPPSCRRRSFLLANDPQIRPERTLARPRSTQTHLYEPSRFIRESVLHDFSFRRATNLPLTFEYRCDPTEN